MDDADICRRRLRHHRPRCQAAPSNEARAQGIKVGLIRPITLWPFPDRRRLPRLRGPRQGSCSCVEMSMGQMVEDVRAGDPLQQARFSSVGRIGGMIPTPAEVLARIKTMAEGGA